VNFVFDPGLVLYLPLYELDSAVFMSRDYHGHTCVVTGARWRPNGHYFDGNDDKINCGHPSVFDLTSLSIWAWICLWAAAPPNAWEGMVDKNDAYSLRLDQNSTNAYGRFKVGGVTRVSNLYPLSLKQWYNLVLSVDGSRTAGNVRLFANGEEVVGATDTGGTLDTNSNDLYIGTTAGVFFINATIGEVAIYNRALSSPEIQRNYLATKWRYR